jgi:hypothetical protein
VVFHTLGNQLCPFCIPLNLYFCRVRSGLIILKVWKCRVRTSSGTFLTRGQDKIIQTIEQRIADFTFIPVGKSKGRCVSVSPDCFAEPVTQ